MAICDPDTDDEPIDNLKTSNFNNRRKLSFSEKESSSSTSEFDPDDIIEPKTVIKKREFKLLLFITIILITVVILIIFYNFNFKKTCSNSNLFLNSLKEFNNLKI